MEKHAFPRIGSAIRFTPPAMKTMLIVTAFTLAAALVSLRLPENGTPNHLGLAQSNRV
jgi:hypothetical protein